MPKQTSAQILGRLGERWFQSILPPEFVFTRPAEDFGIDGVVAIGGDQMMTPVEFGVQVKASHSWSIQDDSVVVQGIAIETLRYWAGRLLPTLIVLYDAEAKAGYFAWAPEVISKAHLEKSTKTTSLRVPRTNSLGVSCWPGIKDQAVAYHRQLASAFATLSDARPVLRAVRALAQALRLLGLPRSVNVSGEDSMLRQLADVVAHREVVTSLRALASTLNKGHALQASLVDAADTYRSICSSFLHPFDDLLRGTDQAVAVWANDERMAHSSPQLMSIITDLIVGLSTIAIPEFGASRSNKALHPSAARSTSGRG
jgi:hypothetical protein